MSQSAVQVDLSRQRWRLVLALDLGLFNVAIFFFALLPPSSLIFPEWIAIIASVVCLIGLVAHASPRVHLPFEQWSYIMTCWLGTISFLAYEHTSNDPYYLKVPFGLFLLSGIASAFAAHVIDGGKRAVGV